MVVVESNDGYVLVEFSCFELNIARIKNKRIELVVSLVLHVFSSIDERFNTLLLVYDFQDCFS